MNEFFSDKTKEFYIQLLVVEVQDQQMLELVQHEYYLFLIQRYLMCDCHDWNEDEKDELWYQTYNLRFRIYSLMFHYAIYHLSLD